VDRPIDLKAGSRHEIRLFPWRAERSDAVFWGI
jgi:hypothetical protein